MNTRLEVIQKTVLLGTACIIKKVLSLKGFGKGTMGPLETGCFLLSLRFHPEKLDLPL